MKMKRSQSEPTQVVGIIEWKIEMKLSRDTAKEEQLASTVMSDANHN